MYIDECNLHTDTQLLFALQVQRPAIQETPMCVSLFVQSSTRLLLLQVQALAQDT